MKWQDRRRSGTVEDRRGQRLGTGARVGGIGGLGLIVVVVVGMLLGVDPMELLQGVPTTNLPPSHMASLFEGGTSPVNMTGSGRSRWSVRNFECCSTRGLVGAMNRTFPGFFTSVSAITMSATTVLPIPVGRTTSVGSSRAAFAMLSW